MKHPQQIISERLRAGIPELVGKWQADNPDCLLPTAFVTVQAAQELGVSRVSIAKHLTDMVRDGRLVEILMYRDRRLEFAGHVRRRLYAVEAGDVYEVTSTAPHVRGANGVSFIITHEGLEEFVRLHRVQPRRDG